MNTKRDLAQKIFALQKELDILKESLSRKDKKVIVFDLDGVVADNEHRAHFITGKKKDWASFYLPNEILKDEPVDEFVTMVRIFNSFKEYTVCFITGREESCRKATQTWLDKYDLKHSGLYMRNIEDFRKDWLVKRELFYKMLGELGDTGFTVAMVFDNSSAVIEMVQEEFSEVITCLVEGIVKK